jgi:hypothetical protein
MKRDYRTYVGATQRGFVYGICDQDGTRYCERFVHCSDWSVDDLDSAYMHASMSASAMLSTVKRGRIDLIRDWGAMPGNVYAQ